MVANETWQGMGGLNWRAAGVLATGGQSGGWDIASESCLLQCEWEAGQRGFISDASEEGPASPGLWVES